MPVPSLWLLQMQQDYPLIGETIQNHWCVCEQERKCRLYRNKNSQKNVEPGEWCLKKSLGVLGCVKLLARCVLGALLRDDCEKRSSTLFANSAVCSLVHGLWNMYVVKIKDTGLSCSCSTLEKASPSSAFLVVSFNCMWYESLLNLECGMTGAHWALTASSF